MHLVTLYKCDPWQRIGTILTEIYKHQGKGLGTSTGALTQRIKPKDTAKARQRTLQIGQVLVLSKASLAASLFGNDDGPGHPNGDSAHAWGFFCCFFFRVPWGVFRGDALL